MKPSTFSTKPRPRWNDDDSSVLISSINTSTYVYQGPRRELKNLIEIENNNIDIVSDYPKHRVNWYSRTTTKMMTKIQHI